jgi:hypothetical protein
MVDRGIALSFLDPGARRGWLVSTTPRPLYSREKPVTHYAGGWMGSRVVLDVCEKSRPHRDFFFLMNQFIFLITNQSNSVHCPQSGYKSSVLSKPMPLFSLSMFSVSHTHQCLVTMLSMRVHYNTTR